MLNAFPENFYKLLKLLLKTFRIIIIDYQNNYYRLSE